MTNTLIERKDVKIEDTWDLSLLYKNDEEFEKDFKSMEEFSKEVIKFKGNLSKSANELKNILDSIMKASIILDKLGTYAFLKQTEDLTNDPKFSFAYGGDALVGYDLRIIDNGNKNNILRDWICAGSSYN